MKVVVLSLAMAALVSAQQTNITLIPAGISSDCNTLLQAINSDAGLTACVQPLITATASFNPTSGANLSVSDINWTLANMCKVNTGCSDSTIRTWLSRFYASCSAELTNPTTYNAQVRELYDILYVVNPLKGAVCSIDSANQQYCVNQVIGVGKNSTGPSTKKNSTAAPAIPVSSTVVLSAGVSASAASAASAGSSLAAAISASSASLGSSLAAASVSASVSSVSGSISGSATSASASVSSASSAASASTTSAGSLPGTGAMFASFASNWSPVDFAAENLYIAYSGASSIARRMVDLLPRQDQAQQATLATVITPNATTYRNTNLPFLFLQPSFNAESLCTPCTREIMVSYIKWETAVPYALGLAQSPILGGQMDLWKSIDQTCGSTYVAAINAQVGQFVGITNSSSDARAVMGVAGGMGLGSAMMGAAAVAGAMAFLV